MGGVNRLQPHDHPQNSPNFLAVLLRLAIQFISLFQILTHNVKISDRKALSAVRWIVLIMCFISSFG